MKRLLCFVLILSLPLVINAQTYTLFNSSNSDLPVNGLYDFDFDNYGNIWFAGIEDGVGLAKVSMLSSDLSTWTVYDASSSELGLDQTDDRVFYVVVDHFNTKWFCTHYGVSYLKNDATAGAVLVDDYTISAHADKKGIIYISNREDGTIQVSEDGGQNWTAWTKETIGMTDGKPEIYDIGYDGMGRLWICTHYGIFYRDLAGDWQVVDEIEGNYTNGMTIDLMDRVWVPNYDTYELYEIASDGTVTTHDSTEIEPLKYRVTDLVSDCHGHVWCATRGGGLLEIKPDGSYESYTTASTGGELPSDELYSVKTHCGALWVATYDDGVVRLPDMLSTTTFVEPAEDANIPSNFNLYTNYPNPFNPATTITFDLKTRTDVKLSVFDLRGRLVQTLINRNMNPGSHQIKWNGRDMNNQPVSTGVYIYRLKTAERTFCRKMMLIK